MKIKKVKQKLNWYLTNPIVKIWRELDKNSFLETCNYINEHWDVGNNPYTCGRVAAVVDQYLELLGTYVKTSLKNELYVYRIRRTKEKLRKEFNLNNTELTILYNSIYDKR